MLKVLKTYILSLCVWEGVVAASLMIMYVLAGRKSLGPEDQRYLSFAGIVGLVVASLCWFTCRKLARVGSVLAGIALGVTIPIVAGWIGGKAADHWITGWGHYRTALDLWIEGLQLSLPSGIAGAVIGLYQGRKATQHSAHALYSR